MTERLDFHFSLSCTGEGDGNPLQYSCLENPRDEGAWWAVVYGVAQSRTRLKRLSSSSSSMLMSSGKNSIPSLDCILLTEFILQYKKRTAYSISIIKRDLTRSIQISPPNLRFVWIWHKYCPSRRNLLLYLPSPLLRCRRIQGDKGTKRSCMLRSLYHYVPSAYCRAYR